MKKAFPPRLLPVLIILLLLSSSISAQDKVYRSDGTVIKAKVTEVEPTLLRYTRTEIPNGPVYTVRLRDIDSVVYENGMVDNMIVVAPRRIKKDNIPQLNTWNFNVLGFANLSISQAYERRTRNGKIGFRVPLYIGFASNRIAGVGTFIPLEGVNDMGAYPFPYVRKSINVAVGFNPKFYLFKHRVIRVFAGPEADIGFTVHKYSPMPNDGYYYYPQVDENTRAQGTFSALSIVGISLNPKDKFNITIHGGAGIGSIFSKSLGVEWTGVWQIGVSLGTNF
jgi:hypothetical protein